MRASKWSTRSALAAAGWLVVAAAAQAEWPSAGRDLKNSRYQSDERALNSRTVGGLQLKWALAVDGDVTANPAVDGQHLYFPDNKGNLYKVEKKTGAQVWKRRISDYTGIPGDFARASPVISGNTLILGNNSGKFLGPALGQAAPQPARVFALDKRSGDPLWVTQVDHTVMSFITHSAIVAGDVALVGVASNEELVAAFVPKAYWNWQFRGSVVALDVRTGAIRWKTYMVPEGYYGGAIWGSTGAVDMARRTVYMATGNNYAVPQSVLDCLTGGGSPATCMAPGNHIDSIVALDLDSGAIRWASKGLDYDAWNVGCGLSVPGFTLPPNDNCPVPTGPDWDFAQGAMLLGQGGTLVGAGQKSGKFWAFDARTGALAWATQVAPGGLTGGLQWGSASDGRRIFVAVANSGPTGSAQVPTPWTLKDGSSTVAGGWAALDARTGSVLWTTPDPGGSRAEAAVSAAADVVFGCNLAFGVGTMYALDANTGRPLWSFDSGAPCNAGPSISDGMVFWGSGTYIGAPGANKVFAFGL
jgi:polyvinyl alcohol dehydrogenase (cytochrome)